MKNWIFTMVLCSMFSLSFAQFTFTKTKLEDAISTKDFLYKQEVFTVENIPNFRMDAVKITNLENFNSTSGLRVVHRKQVGKGQRVDLGARRIIQLYRCARNRWIGYGIAIHENNFKK